MFNFYVAKGFALKVGVQPEFLLSAKFKNSAGDGLTEDLRDKESFGLSIPIGASYEFGGNWVVDARFDLGLTKIAKVLDDEKLKSRVIAVTLGYKFDL